MVACGKKLPRLVGANIFAWFLAGPVGYLDLCTRPLFPGVGG